MSAAIDNTHAVTTRPPKSLGWLLAVALLAVGGAVAARRHYGALLAPVGAGAERVFVVRPGDGPATIGRKLVEAGLIRDGRAFRRRARERGLDQRLQAGSYLLSPAGGVDAILDRLARGEVARRKVTIPEGLTIAEVASRAAAAGVGPVERFLALAERPPAELRPTGLPDGASLEGYLYPETYYLAIDDGPEALIRAQTRRFEEVWAKLTAGRAPRRPMAEVVTIASLVEEEARWDDERARIAGVIENRLRRGQRLELCATVIYALGEHRTRLLERDLLVPSPYNTYLHPGLPPGPICSPGGKSLAAALTPEAHDRLYYVLGKDGRHVFSRTYAEHLAAKRVAEKARAGS